MQVLQSSRAFSAVFCRVVLSTRTKFYLSCPFYDGKSKFLPPSSSSCIASAARYRLFAPCAFCCSSLKKYNEVRGATNWNLSPHVSCSLPETTRSTAVGKPVTTSWSCASCSSLAPLALDAARALSSEACASVGHMKSGVVGEPSG